MTILINMESIDCLGVFWLSDREPETCLTGRLIISPDTSGELRLVGILDDLNTANTDASPPNLTLHGWIDTKEVTLLDCWISSSPRRTPGVNETVLHVGAVLKNGHMCPPLQFTVGRLRTSLAVDWIGTRVVNRHSAAGKERPIEWLEYGRPEPITHPIAQGELRISYSYQASPPSSNRRIEFEHWPVFSIEYNELTALSEIQHDLGIIESLVSFCVDKISTTQAVKLEHPDHKERSIAGTEFPFPRAFEYIAKQIMPPATSRQRHDFQMLLTFEELGGIAIVSEFINKAPQFRRSLDSLMSVKRAQQMFTENRFLNVAFAAESYHRDVYGGICMPDAEFEQLKTACAGAVDERWAAWLSQRLQHANEVSLRTRLRELFEYAGKDTLPFIKNPKKWINVLVGVRNNITHLSSKNSGFEGSDLYYLSESLFSLVRSNMLVFSGASPDAIALRAGSDQLAWYADRLNATVSKLDRRL